MLYYLTSKNMKINLNQPTRKDNLKIKFLKLSFVWSLHNVRQKTVLIISNANPNPNPNPNTNPTGLSHVIFNKGFYKASDVIEAINTMDKNYQLLYEKISDSVVLVKGNNNKYNVATKTAEGGKLLKNTPLLNVIGRNEFGYSQIKLGCYFDIVCDKSNDILYRTDMISTKDNHLGKSYSFKPDLETDIKFDRDVINDITFRILDDRGDDVTKDLGPFSIIVSLYIYNEH